MIGIENVNEFYTHHYLAAILSSEVRPHLERWREEAREGGDKAPWRQLGQLQQPFFRYRERLARLRTADERVDAHVEISQRLLAALGYEVRPVRREIDAGALPLLAEARRGDGEPVLWILPVATAAGAEGDVLAQPLLAQQQRVVDTQLSEPDATLEGTVEELVSDAFQHSEPPRFVLIAGEGEWILADRGKWVEQRLLRFDLEELLGRRDQTLEVMTALLHRETLAPASGTSLVDTFDDSSHKHAYEVSEDLKYALQASIEAIGNEAIRYRREVSKKKVYGEEIDAQQLAIECIRYMYRILFLLYIEARPELGYAPMGSDAYRLGYSFERLRDLEMVELDSDEARGRHSIDLSLRHLFRMIYEGTPELERQESLLGRGADDESTFHTFRLVPLKSHLFDPARTPFLNSVKLRDGVMLEVIRSMSLSRPHEKGKGKKRKVKRRGRISYATLGINQLGAVYEALLSFRGFFAEETLYEVKKAEKDKKNKKADNGKPPDPVNEAAYFVPESELGQYKKNERVYDATGEVKAYAPGSFIYRMAGRDRQLSASYYTPEVLTRSLVKYALAEALEDADGQPRHGSAEDLLELTICEPAMGSAAFLNEAINQLAERYLSLRQQELGQRIPHERYAHELQRVRMYLADNNVFGVDLNPVAMELAEISLWLNAIFTRESARGREVFVPWFGGQLCAGNSLVGAWRKVFGSSVFGRGPVARGTRSRLLEGEGSSPWLDAVPERVPLGEAREAGSIYHFLLPDRGMAVYGQGSEGKPIRQLCGEELRRIDAWRKEICAPLSLHDRDALVRLSDAIDRLWRKHAELLARIRRRTTDPQSVYGHEHPLAGKAPISTEEKDRIWQKEMASEQVRASSPYRRLKLAMDYWCALWFWPVEEAEMLPDREEWLTDLALLLDSDVLPSLSAAPGQRQLFAPTMPAEEAQSLVEELGFADVEGLIARWPRLRLVDELAQRYRFHHWELEFADVFTERGGFDLIVGNPPWVRVEWKEAGILGDHDPSFVLGKLSATQTSKRRAAALERQGMLQAYLAAHEAPAGMQAFLSANGNYPELQGVKVNLYKAFLPVAWTLSSERGVTGLVHPDSIYDDPKGGTARRASYQRLRQHYAFINELKLFAEVDNHTRYSVNIYGTPDAEPRFINIANLFMPQTIDECHSHPGIGPVPGIKDDENRWEVRGHKERILRVGEEELALFAQLYDEAETPALEARLPSIHSNELVEALEEVFARVPQRLSDLGKDQYFATFHFNETYAQKDGTIRRDVGFPASIDQWILSGPHFFVGNPLYKTPRAKVVSNKSYDVLDLTELPDDYLPRTIYVPNVGPAEYRSRAPKVPWSQNEVPTAQYSRLIVAKRIGPTSERTLQAAMIPPGPAHLASVYSYTFADLKYCVITAATWMAVPLDFLLKTSGAVDLTPSTASRLPVAAKFQDQLCVRAASIVCLTKHYAATWQELFDRTWRDDAWTLEMPGLDPAYFGRLDRDWHRDCAVRAEAARRAVLVEIDVLVAMALGLTLEQLQTLYRVQFPVLRGYEADTWYDQNGRIVFTASKGLPGVGLPRTKKKDDPEPCWKEVEHLAAERGHAGEETVTQVVEDDTLPGGVRQKTIVYRAPWVRCDRERDYARAWQAFSQRFGGEKV